MPAAGDNRVLLAVILVILLLLIVHFGVRLVRRYCVWRRERYATYAYDTPAQPVLAETGAQLATFLVALRGRAGEMSLHLAAAGPGSAAALGGMQKSVDVLTGALAPAIVQLQTAGSYATYYAVYHALSTADADILRAAAEYERAGRTVMQTLAADEAAGPPSPHVVAVGNDLIAIARLLREVVVAVQRLGVALDAV